MFNIATDLTPLDKLYTYLKRSYSIVLLLLVYVLSTQMEKEQDSAQPATQNAVHISKKHPSLLVTRIQEPVKQPKKDPGGRHPRKIQVAKHISLKLATPVTARVSPSFLQEPAINYAILQDKYSFLFFREINPPPPKAC